MIPDEKRAMPQTRPDEEARTHRARCVCDVCLRPGAMRLKQLEARRVRA